MIIGNKYHRHHECELITAPYHHHLNNHYMVPHHLLHLMFLGSAAIFAVLMVGLLVIVDRARLTPVVRARGASAVNSADLIRSSNNLARALVYFSELNRN